MSSSNTAAKVPDTDGSERQGGDASDAKSAKEQTEDATMPAAVIEVEANRSASITRTPAVRSPSCENMNNPSERMVPPRVKEVNDSDNEMMHAKTKYFTNQAQGSDGALQAEGGTDGATWNAVDQSGESRSPDDIENAPVAGLQTSSIASTGHQQAHTPQQGHNNRASILPAMLLRGAIGQQHSQARRRGHTKRASLISAIIQRTKKYGRADQSRPTSR